MKYFSLCAALILLSGSTLLADEPTISLSGQGAVSAEPDQGYITVGVVNLSETSAEAVRENAQTMVDLYATLKEQGVPKTDIQTVRYSIDENWKEIPTDNRNTRRVRDGYRVTNMVRVTVCELDNFGKILDAVVADGANTINGIQFGSSKENELRDKARVLAVEDAVRRAELLTEPLGLKLGKVQGISESQSYGGYRRDYMMESAVAAASTPVSGGSLTFTATVNISWELTTGKSALKIKLPDAIELNK